MPYEWDEEVPQPKPPTRHCRLLVESYEPKPGIHAGPSTRDATQADIARALGVTEASLADFLAGRLTKLLGLSAWEANGIAGQQQRSLSGDGVAYGPGGRNRDPGT